MQNLFSYWKWQFEKKNTDQNNLSQTRRVFVHHGGNHDWYKNTQSGKCQPIPRHTEIEDWPRYKNG